MNGATAYLVARDVEGIAGAYRELLEHDLAARSAPALGGKSPEFAGQFAAGYYTWVNALLRQEQRNAVNPAITLPADYTDGLAALSRVRAQFAHGHPPCPRCGVALLTAQDTVCWQCGHSWKEEASR